MKTIALFNPRAGSVPADARERLGSVLAEAGIHGAELIEIDPADCGRQIERLVEPAPDLFIAWGGDGTLRAALTTVGQITPNLLLLPGGTMNLLPRAIHGEKTWDQVVRDVLAAPRRLDLPAGDVNGQRFYCAMLAGAPARFAEARESLRQGDIGKAAAEARAALDVLNSMHLEASYAEGYSFVDQRLPPTSVIGAVIGSLTRAGSGMEVAALENPTAGGALNVIWTSFFSDWRNAPGVAVAPAASFDIRSPADDIPLIADGEHVDAGRHARVRFIATAAQCLAAA